MATTFLALSQAMPESGRSEAEAAARRSRRLSFRSLKIQDKKVKKVAKTYMFSVSIRSHTFWSTLLTIICLVVSIVLGFFLNLPEVSAVIPFDGPDDVPMVRRFQKYAYLLIYFFWQISVAIDFLSVDPSGGTLVADWYLFHSDCSKPEIVANIFFDELVT
jgi:hypothetical protein